MKIVSYIDIETLLDKLDFNFIYDDNTGIYVYENDNIIIRIKKWNKIVEIIGFDKCVYDFITKLSNYLYWE